jgi:hypothetical protein
MSPPCAPELPTTAPPNVPGMPMAHSSPPSPLPMHCRASDDKFMPDSTVQTTCAPVWRKRTVLALVHDHQAAHAVVGDQNVGTAAEDEVGNVLGIGQFNGRLQFQRVLHRQKHLRRATHARRRVFCQRRV